MSRLLQALKNLEARGQPTAERPVAPQPTAKPASGKGLLAHLAEKFHTPTPDPPKPVASTPAAPAKPTPIEPREASNPLAYLSTGVPTILLQPPPVATPFEPVFVSGAGLQPANQSRGAGILPADRNVGVPPALAEGVSGMQTTEQTRGAGILPAEIQTGQAGRIPDESGQAGRLPDEETPASSRQPTLLERSIRRTLADPARSQPFRDLAERLWSDLAPLASRTVLLTGIGPPSATHDVVLHTAALLAEHGEPILVVDADAAHRTLTCQLDLPDARGLVEAVESDAAAHSLTQSTTLNGVSILPFGKARFRDLAESANRLAAALQSLESEYRLVLIDGGRTSELTAATLARLCDATYFVIRLGETEAALAQATVRDFRAAGARVLGCIATSS
jgi:Mrp family chromosome partitioning ATPase